MTFPDEQRTAVLVVSDYICPWCYLGIAELDRLASEFDLDITFAPYLLDPTIPPEGQPRTPQMAPDAPPSEIESRGAALGLQYRRGRSRTSNSHLAHEAAEWASDHGDPGPFHRRLLRAYFEELADISDVDLLATLAEECGLDGAGLRAALIDGSYRDVVDEGLAWTQEIGVTGVPTFIFDEKLAIVGAQDYPVFLRVMKKLGKSPKDPSGPVT